MSRSVVVCPDCKTPVQPKELLPTAWRGDYYDCVGCSKPFLEKQFKVIREMSVARGGHVLGGQSAIADFGRIPLGTTSGTTNSGTSLTLLSGVSLDSGDGLVLYIGYSTSSLAIATVTWNGNPLTYEVASEQGIGGTASLFSCLYLANAPAGSGDLIADLSVTGELTEWVGFATRVTGANATLKDRSKAGTGTSASPSSSATSATLFANELLVGAVAWYTAAISGTWSNSFTAGQSVANGTTMCMEEGYRLVTAKAAYTAAKTVATNTDWAAGILTCRSV